VAQIGFSSGSTEVSDLLKLVIRHRKFILFFSLLATISAAIFSGPSFVKPVYKSEVILYPPGTNSNKVLIEKDPRFGADNEVEQEIQILKSGLVRDTVLRKYNLMKHYEIDSISSLKNYKLIKEYESNVLVERTRYSSISVTVYDTDPLLAATMANDIVKIGDHVKSEVLKQNLSSAFHSLEKEYNAAQKEADELADKVSSLSGIPYPGNTSFENKPGAIQVKEQIDLQQAILQARKKNQNYLLNLLYDYQNKLQRLMELRWSYDQAAGYINLDVPASYVISPAEVSYKKDSPNRKLIILFTAVTAFLVATATVALKERYRNFSFE
jgi:uncharacterized protein involved in exopolysaccharide biosynthesis